MKLFKSFFLLIFICNTALQAEGMLNLLHKIKVDDKGTKGAIDGCAFSTKGDLIAASDNSGTTKVYRVSDGTLVAQVKHSEKNVKSSGGETNAIHFSPDDQFMLTGMNKTGCKVWNVKTGELVKNLGRGENTDGAAFSPNGYWLAVAHNNRACVYEWPSYQKIAEYKVRRGEVNSIDWASDNSLLVIGGDGADIKVMETSTWKEKYHFNFKVDRVKSVRFSPDNSMLAVSGQNGQVWVYAMGDGKKIVALKHESEAVALPGDDNDGKQPNVEAVEWSSDSKHLFTGGLYSGIIRVWRVADWSLVAWTQGQEWSRQVEYLAINNHDILAAGGDEGYLYLWKFRDMYHKKPFTPSLENDNIIVIETEDFDANLPMGKHHWKIIDDNTASGGKKVQALPDLMQDGHGMDKNYMSWDPKKGSPKLDYRITIKNPGTYYIWTRAKGENVYANSFHIGMNGQPVESSDRIENDSKQWLWDNHSKDKERPTLNLKAGTFTLNMWLREDGVQVDKIVLVRSETWKPKKNSFGPETKPRLVSIK